MTEKALRVNRIAATQPAETAASLLKFGLKERYIACVWKIKWFADLVRSHDGRTSSTDTLSAVLMLTMSAAVSF